MSLLQFAFATLFVLPRAMVYVFVGSRIARLSDGEQRSHMDASMQPFLCRYYSYDTISSNETRQQLSDRWRHRDHNHFKLVRTFPCRFTLPDQQKYGLLLRAQGNYITAQQSFDCRSASLGWAGRQRGRRSLPCRLLSSIIVHYTLECEVTYHGLEHIPSWT